MNIEKIARSLKLVVGSVALSGIIVVWSPLMPASTVYAGSCAHEIYTWVEMVSPTCSRAGEKAKICEDCETILETESTAKKKHAGKWLITRKATCTSTGVKSRICKNCRTVIETKAIPKKSHSYKWTKTTEATCTGNGIKSHKCKNCGYVDDTKAIEAKGHKYGSWSIQSATVIGRNIKVSTSRPCKFCNKNHQTVTGISAAFSDKHDIKKYYYKLTPKTGRITILCSECHQSVTGTMNGGTIRFTRPKRTNSKPASKGWKALR